MISVCIPAYNAAQTLPYALDSVISQTFRDFEVLIVNDGSTDATETVIERYAAEDKRIKALKTTVNQGTSAARRKLIDNAGREYVFWLDADDYIEPDALEQLRRAAEQTGADVIGFGERKKNADGTISRIYCDYANIRRTMIQTLKRFSICLRPFTKTEVLRKCRMVTRNFCEDFLLTLQSLVYAEKTAMLPKFIYYYIYNPLSICHAHRNLAENIRNAITAMAFAETFLLEHGYPDLAELAKNEKNNLNSIIV